MSTSTTQSTFVAVCNTSGNATSCTQCTTTQYFIDGMLIGQNSSNATLTLPQLQTIVAALVSA